MLQKNRWPIPRLPPCPSHRNSLHAQNITILCCHLKKEKPIKQKLEISLNHTYFYNQKQ